MKQVLQHARTGQISVEEVPVPKLLPGCVLVQIAASLVSAGTERAVVEFASKNLLQKAKARPDLVREVMGKARRDGILTAVSAVRSRLDEPLSLGYSSAGTVIEVGDGVNGFSVGDRVACAGAGYAVHAECAAVPQLLNAKISSTEVSFDEAAFTTMGAVALHGIRTADVKIGDIVAVIGLGLVGQLTAQLLKAAGCRVIGLDLSSSRASLARDLGTDQATFSSQEFEALCIDQSSGLGVDSVLITAETASSEPVNLASNVVRDRGIVVAVGTVGMDIDRKGYYEKELQFRVSRSYGPGRYDSAYEQKGRDYPIGYVRWTETRNMQAFLNLLAEEKVNVRSLITHRVPIDQAKEAYEVITGGRSESFLGVLITYKDTYDQSPRLEMMPGKFKVSSQKRDVISIGLLGVGTFAKSTLLPAMKQVDGITFVGACSATGRRARNGTEKFKFEYCCTNEAEILRDPNINTVVIATRNHLHGQQVVAALQSGKHVFCEKPLCLHEAELAEIITAHAQARTSLVVGFNRRFAPMSIQMKRFVSEMKGPLALHYRVNAGSLPADHWLNDNEQGGGRLLAEACHFVDFLAYLVGESPTQVQTRSFEGSNENVIITMEFTNGSHGTITYLANGDRAFSKERVEVFGGGSVAVLDDFRQLELVRGGKRKVTRSHLRQDKGHVTEWQVFAKAIRSGSPAPIAFEDIVATTLTTLRAAESRLSGQPVAVDPAQFIAKAVLHSRE
ncbi:MAG TPA: bi-domain-containing oxidoreductase [Terriglobales bacterium]|jgi:predicted dehydrogenase/threonine dehydrogenase-like Zn-dependent dehydrogenase